MNLIEVKVSIF